ncbi:MAG: AtpZ/AtpI family protein [Lunatimonas sp.]|uniref:AtpZ/AtpI family protein n=1 Tax=Lunatimonas sp. TaxID=2060141 RepID=UPI00263A5EEE|nr:AtpZ/AtpI family protein [Lunatimonas sp.]MCC5937733.1 AtpZ/AtpI family protein [Lunatimonas sp.]
MKIPPQKNTPDYIRFIGLAFQMMALIGLGGYLGHRLDAQTSYSFPVWLLTGSFLGTLIAFYQLFKSLPPNRD